MQLPEAVARAVDAINAADTEAFVEAFTPDGAVDDWGRVLQGRDGVRSWADSDAIGAGAEMTVLSAHTDGDTTHLRFEWRSRVFNGESEAYVTVSGDKVNRFRIPPARP
ncbi:nuclear transport factor 2 family protein [Nocardia carnea]|uniref:nuclear transport factor 2 family protein n=1 Tax=Nocardia carnea TaxID=37328 RepID=UPI0024587D10|nr:nuclear transport factor 2 family protein [Nocardia carnea]